MSNKSNKPKSLSGQISGAIADLFPGYFALVMATGIVSIAASLLEMPWIAWILLWINAAAYAVLSLMLGIRIVWFFPHVKADLMDHMRAPGFFTVVAGTCILGSQLIIVAGEFKIAAGLWYVSVFLWTVIMYTFFTAVTIRNDKPPLEKGLNGTWLIAAVATQSISVLGILLTDHFGVYRDIVFFFTLCMFMGGCMLYLLLITLIFYRFTFFNLTIETLTPPYWINMGAVAITTLAGARLILAERNSSFLAELVPFLKGFTLFFWSAGTWWIPLLFILGFWRHVYKRFPLRYDPQYWGMVFPLGMYTVCTFQLSRVINFEPLMLVPKVFIYLAFGAWVATSVGFISGFFVGRKES